MIERVPHTKQGLTDTRMINKLKAVSGCLPLAIRSSVTVYFVYCTNLCTLSSQFILRFFFHSFVCVISIFMDGIFVEKRFYEFYQFHLPRAATWMTIPSENKWLTCVMTTGQRGPERVKFMKRNTEFHNRFPNIWISDVDRSRSSEINDETFRIISGILSWWFFFEAFSCDLRWRWWTVVARSTINNMCALV